MKKHVFVIRSSYKSDYPLEAKKRRLELTHKYCITSLSHQSCKDFEIAVLVSHDDPFLQERKDLFESIGVPVHYTSGFILPFSNPIWQTRFNSDDAIAPDYVERVQQALIKPMQGRPHLTFSIGYVLQDDGRLQTINHPRISILTRLCFPGESVYSENHSRVKQLLPVDRRPAYLYVRHRDTGTKMRRTSGLHTVNEEQRILANQLFPLLSDS